MRISFDFNDVLDTVEGYELAEQKVRQGHDVFIITALRPSQNVKDLGKRLGIPATRIIFTSGRDKYYMVKALDIDVHYDNNKEQIEKIMKNTNAKGVLVNYG